MQKIARSGTWLLAPVHVAALATGAKSFRDNPVIGSTRLNRRGLHVARMVVAARMAAWRRARLAHLVNAEDRAAFARDGFIVKPDFLPAGQFAALQREVMNHAAPARDMIQGDAVTRRIALDRRALAALPAVRRMVESKEWLGLVRYAGASSLEPLAYIQTVFARVRSGGADPQTRLHSDAFHSSVKAWLFLDDVAEDGGAFTYVPGSHRLTKRRLAWDRRRSIEAAASADYQSSRGSPRLAERELKRLGYAAPCRFAVKANTLIVADTLGFHARGPSAGPSVRIEIWAYGRRNPFLPWLRLDPAALPGIKGRVVPLFWRSADALERWGFGRNVWRDAGLARPDAPPDLALHR